MHDVMKFFNTSGVGKKTMSNLTVIFRELMAKEDFELLGYKEENS
jgi:hypothetical protein